MAKFISHGKIVMKGLPNSDTSVGLIQTAQRIVPPAIAVAETLSVELSEMVEDVRPDPVFKAPVAPTENKPKKKKGK